MLNGIHQRVYSRIVLIYTKLANVPFRTDYCEFRIPCSPKGVESSNWTVNDRTFGKRTWAFRNKSKSTPCIGFNFRTDGNGILYWFKFVFVHVKFSRPSMPISNVFILGTRVGNSKIWSSMCATQEARVTPRKDKCSWFELHCSHHNLKQVLLRLI